MGILVATVSSSGHQVGTIDLLRDDTPRPSPLLPRLPTNGLRPFGSSTPFPTALIG
jgi:hypothetical protein